MFTHVEGHKSLITHNHIIIIITQQIKIVLTVLLNTTFKCFSSILSVFFLGPIWLNYLNLVNTVIR